MLREQTEVDLAVDGQGIKLQKTENLCAILIIHVKNETFKLTVHVRGHTTITKCWENHSFPFSWSHPFFTQIADSSKHSNGHKKQNIPSPFTSMVKFWRE